MSTNGHHSGLAGATAALLELRPRVALPYVPATIEPLDPAGQPPSIIEAGAIGNAQTLAELEEIAALGTAVQGYVLKFAIDYWHKYNTKPTDDVIRSHADVAPKTWAVLFAEWNPPKGPFSYWRDELERSVAARQVLAAVHNRETLLLAERDPGAAAAQFIEKLGALKPAQVNVGLPFRSAAEIARTTPEDLDPIWEPYVYRGAITELNGPSKTGGKTTLLMSLNRGLTVTSVFMGKPVRRRKVVFLTEEGPRSIRHALLRAHLLESEDLFVLHRADVFHLSYADLVRQTTEYAARIGAELVIVDTLLAFTKGEAGAANDGPTALANMALWDTARAKDIAVLIVRHERKSGGDTAEAGAGTTEQTGAADMVLSLRRLEGNVRPTLRRLAAEGRFDCPPSIVIERMGDGTYEERGTETAVAQSEARAKVLEALPASEDAALTVKQLAEVTGCSRTTTQRALEELGEQVSRAVRKTRGSPTVHWRGEGS